jgi:hypothetical protein
MPLHAMESEAVEPTESQLEAINKEIDAYVATLSPEEQEEYNRAVAEIEEEYDRQFADEQANGGADEAIEVLPLDEQVVDVEADES